MDPEKLGLKAQGFACICLDKHHSLNLSAEALIKSGTGVIAAKNLH